MHDTLQQVEDKLDVERMLTRSGLGERQILVLRLRFGLDGPAMNLREIGERIGRSKARVQQIEARALRKIRLRNGLREHEQQPYSLPIQRDPYEPPVLPESGSWFPTYPAGQVQVTCDRCDARFVSVIWHAGGTLLESKRTVARELAAEAGWSIGDEDLCPKCVSEKSGVFIHAEQVPGPAPLDAGGGP